MVRLPIVLGIVGLMVLAPRVQAASWLDSPPANWNEPHQRIPKAPPVETVNPRCGAEERAAGRPEEEQLSAAGWKLELYWPAETVGQLTLVSVLAGYDGMCRPMAFDVFAFHAGAFAGTLAPAPMDSREDGQLAGSGSGMDATATGDNLLTAEFLRYRAGDPRCCPSGGRTRVTYRLQTVDAAPVLVPIEIGSMRSAESQPAWQWAAIAVLAIGAGTAAVYIWRKRAPGRASAQRR